MASLSLMSGLRPLSKVLLSRPALLDTRVAFICGKALRPLDYERYPPWPYKEKSYTNWHYFYDNTIKRFDENSKVIFVEGMPGIGKSDFAKALAEELDMKYFPMVNTDLIYVNYYGYDMRKLDPELPKSVRSYDEKRFFREPKHERNVSFQTNLLILKVHQYFDALAHILNTGQGVIMERSPYSDFVFMEAMYKCKYLDKIAYQAYNKHNKALLDILKKPHLVIYLDAPNSLVYENLKKRGQGEENAITPEFLDAMEEKYKFKFLKNIEEHAEILIYDWAVPGDIEVIVEDIERIDFDRHDEGDFNKHNPKMLDWRFDNDDEANEARWMYTRRKLEMVTGVTLVSASFDCKGMFADSTDWKVLVDKTEALPGMKYQIGFNPSVGDKVLFKDFNKQVFPELMLRNYHWS